MEFADNGNLASYLERIAAQSDFEPGVTVPPQDRIVTLSTCAYDCEDACYVLHCKLVPTPDENEERD